MTTNPPSPEKPAPEKPSGATWNAAILATAILFASLNVATALYSVSEAVRQLARAVVR